MGDDKGAVLRVTGRVLDRGSQSVNLLVETLEEERNGSRAPPITRSDIVRVVGPSRLNPLQGHWSKEGGESHLTLTIDRDTQWSIGFHRDADGGWENSDDDDEV